MCVVCVCMRESGGREKEGERAHVWRPRQDLSCCFCHGGYSTLTGLKLPGDSSLSVSHLKVPVLILQMWTTAPGFLYGFQDSLQSSIRLAPWGPLPPSLLTGLEILFVVLVIEVRARQIPLPVSHIPIQLYFLSETIRFSIKHHGRVTINIFLNNQIHIKTLSLCLLLKCSKDFLLDIFFFISK